MLCGEALSGDFLGFHRFQSKTMRAGSRFHDGAGDGMRRAAFHQPGGVEHVFLGSSLGGQDAGYFKDASGQGSGLVESHGLDVVQGVEHMPALDEDTLLGRGADAAEVAERNGDTSAQGQEMTSRTSARYSHSSNVPCPASGGMTATSAAMNTTAGV